MKTTRLRRLISFTMFILFGWLMVGAKGCLWDENTAQKPTPTGSSTLPEQCENCNILTDPPTEVYWECQEEGAHPTPHYFDPARFETHPNEQKCYEEGFTYECSVADLKMKGFADVSLPYDVDCLVFNIGFTAVDHACDAVKLPQTIEGYAQFFKDCPGL